MTAAGDKLKIAVDVDGVLAETMEVWCATVNKLYGKKIRLQDIDSWASWRKFGITKDEFYRILDASWDKWMDIPPTEPGLSRKVAKVARLGMMDIVTGRSERTVVAVKNWLKHHGIRYNQFIRVPGWRYKILLEYDVYIDDAPELMPLISRNPRLHGILYQRPWNMDVPDMPRVFTVSSWTEVPAVLAQAIRAN